MEGQLGARSESRFSLEVEITPKVSNFVRDAGSAVDFVNVGRCASQVDEEHAEGDERDHEPEDNHEGDEVAERTCSTFVLRLVR
jgi:hypothetical protein